MQEFPAGHAGRIRIMLPEAIARYILVFGGCLSLLFSLIHVFIRGKQVENYNLSLLLFILTILQFQFALIISEGALSYPGLLFMHLTFLFLAIPLAYRAYFFVVFPSSDLSGRKWLIFVPACLTMPLDMYYLVQSNAGKLTMIESLLTGLNSRSLVVIRMITGAASLEVLLLLGMLSMRMIKEYRRSRMPITAVNAVYAVITLAASEMVLLGYLLNSMSAVKYGAVIISLLLISSYITGVRYPSLIQLVIIEAKKQYHRKKLLTGIDPESLLFNLERLMEEEKLYTSETLSLKDLADILSITPHQLSHLLNSERDTNFNTFVNQYRIEEAKRLLLEEAERSILTIAYAVGFNSKSTFYDAFSRFTGITPKQYRESRNSSAR